MKKDNDPPTEIPKFYRIMSPMIRPGLKKRYIRIGSATAYWTKNGFGVAMTLDSIPLNWNGECYLYADTMNNPRKDMAEKGEPVDLAECAEESL